MLHHVGIEVRPKDLRRAIEFWQLLGFSPVEAPATLADSFTWLEAGGTQIHLIDSESPTVAPQGHVAVVAAEFDRTVAGLRSQGFDVQPRRQHWGVPRALAIAPGGHRVELMAAAP
jgi:catechol 2,3-dioxygenase-like lactoylglutathione lyase family enzyme